MLVARYRNGLKSAAIYMHMHSRMGWERSVGGDMQGRRNAAGGGVGVEMIYMCDVDIERKRA